MPSLDWIGKNKVINHHIEVPYYTLENKYSYGDTAQSGNMIIHGDNLLALKSLLPRYEGQVDCIYIDPPYNTGNEKWVYNDNVNDPRIKKWLGEVVGTEGEDLSRHDKWLCMMYPRLRLLHKLLAKDGVIFISIDDNEQANLKFICDEIFGKSNFIAQLPRRTINSGKHDALAITLSHDYVFIYAKTNIGIKFVQREKGTQEKNALYPLTDQYIATRGHYYITQLNKNSLQYSDSLNYPIIGPDGQEIWAGGGFDDKQWIWRWRREKVQWGIENDFIVFKKNKKTGKYKVYTKSYENMDKDGNYTVRTNPNTSLDFVENIYTNFNATPELERIMQQKKVFGYPKPTILLESLFHLLDNKNAIVLDSFAGSGTTAHAVLNLNKQDGGNRKFILVEMMDYAESITAERVKRVIDGYGTGEKAAEGTGGGFSYYELGVPLLINNNINENADTDKIREYIYFTETKRQAENKADEKYLLGLCADTAYYFYYEKRAVTTLNREFLHTVKTKASGYVIYADLCTLSESELEKYRITFKKIPRDITKF